MLIGVAAMIFMQSQDMFVETNHKVLSAVHMRGALRSLRQDLVHAVNTNDVEFFNDGDGDGHYSAGEDLTGQEPLPPPGGSANAPGYSHSMALCSATYARTSPPVGNQFRADAIYFRVDPGQPNRPYAVEYRLLATRPVVNFVRRVFRQPNPTGQVVASTEILLEDVISLTFEFKNAQGAWADASAASTLGLRSVTAPEGSIVEMCLEGSGRFTAGERALRVPSATGMASLRPGDRIHLYGASPANSPSQGDFTIKDVLVEASSAVLTFEERLPLAAGDTQVNWRAARLPTAVRARVVMRKRGSADNTLTAESVFKVR
jgi:hypothetical protein